MKLPARREHRDIVPEIRAAKSGVESYLQQLEYVSISFYFPLKADLVNWGGPPQPLELGLIAGEFKKNVKEFSDHIDDSPPLDIGEFGYGTGRPQQPFGDTPGAFVKQNPSGKYEAVEETMNARRKYVLALEKFLTDADTKALFRHPDEHCTAFLPLTFWTVKHFDFLGIWDYLVPIEEQEPSPHELFEDDELKEWVTK